MEATRNKVIILITWPTSGSNVPDYPLCSCCALHVQNEFIFSEFNSNWSWQILKEFEGPKKTLEFVMVHTFDNNVDK